MFRRCKDRKNKKYKNFPKGCLGGVKREKNKNLHFMGWQKRDILSSQYRRTSCSPVLLAELCLWLQRRRRRRRRRKRKMDAIKAKGEKKPWQVDYKRQMWQQTLYEIIVHIWGVEVQPYLCLVRALHPCRMQLSPDCCWKIFIPPSVERPLIFLGKYLYITWYRRLR